MLRVPLGRKRETELAMGRRWATWLLGWDALYMYGRTHVFDTISNCDIVPSDDVAETPLPPAIFSSLCLYISHVRCVYVFRLNHVPGVCRTLYCFLEFLRGHRQRCFCRCRPAAKLFAEFPLALPTRWMKSVELDMVSFDSIYCTACI